MTEQSLSSDLRALGVREGMVLLVHSSLSALGWVCGGPVAVIRALLKALGENGTLVMPAHSTDLSDPAGWKSPPAPAAWWDTIRATMPVFDAAVTPTSHVGVIPELFRTWPGAVRSNHPSCSFTALGRHAGRVVAEQRLRDPMGERSPLAAIYDLNGYLLLLGFGRKVGHRNNTVLHLAERRALGDDQQTIPAGAPILVEGIRQWVTYREPDIDEDDFDEAGAAFERQETTARGGPWVRAAPSCCAYAHWWTSRSIGSSDTETTTLLSLPGMNTECRRLDHAATAASVCDGRGST